MGSALVGTGTSGGRLTLAGSHWQLMMKFLGLQLHPCGYSGSGLSFMGGGKASSLATTPGSARRGCPARRPGGRGPPPPARRLPLGWRWVGARAEGRRPRSFPRRSRLRRRGGRRAVAVRAEPGSPPAAGGAARSRPGDAGRGRGPPAPPASPAPAEREVAANKCKLLGPPGRLGEDPRSGARLPPARVGFAAGPRGAGASPCAAGARWRGASPPPCTRLQVNAEAQSACHRSRSPSAFISRSDPGCVTSSVWL